MLGMISTADKSVEVGLGWEGDELPTGSLRFRRSRHKHISHPHFITGVLWTADESIEVDPKRKDDQSLELIARPSFGPLIDIYLILISSRV
jgi:hypothetical protein